MSDPKKILEMMKEKDVKYVDFRFTDPRGKWQHVAQHLSTVDEDMLTDGIMFDGSSIAGWKAINESDMQLKPDLSTATMDPFAAQPQLILVCDTVDPVTGQAYDRCPRQTAKKAVEYLRSTGIADIAYFGPEAEFFVFDDVRFAVDMQRSFYFVSSEEGPYLTGEEIEGGNLAHRPPIKGGYFPVPPMDSGTDLRAEMVTVMAEMGVSVEKHHHEVAPAQHELGIKFDTLIKCADNMQIYKYVVHNVAASYGKTATFMPKPVKGDNGSGMHCHQSLWKGSNNLFAGQGYAGLSETALYYIAGIIKHAKAINAITNPTTNSYKRLIPGFEAPVLLAYSSRNRSASCRIPFGAGPKAKRVEVRFPDPAANPYLAYTAMLMAGLDGIKNKLHPGDPMDKNLYDLPPEELKNVPQVCGSLREALEALEADHDFLLAGDVFTRDQLESYAELRWEEVYAFEHSPHPIEFQMYYSV
jgi:glutamine synthetase